MRLAAFLTNAIETLKQAGIDNPQLDARLLAGHALGCDRAQLLSQSERVLTDEEILTINALLTRRIRHESVARIIGKREFWGLDFGLNEATLEPRPDSETLIEAVLSSFRRKPESSGARLRDEDSRSNLRILDLGTGTGCLLLSLLHETPEATGLGIDINPRAVEQATINATALGLGSRASFRLGNWLNGITEKFDLIVSNPPYIPASDIPSLMQEVCQYDPLLALDGGEDGLAPYHHLIPQLANFLNPQGLVAFEVGQGQAQQVATLLRDNGFVTIATHKDLSGIERCVTAFRPD